MRKKKWVPSFLENEDFYLKEDLKGFRETRPVYLEIGMGMGDFICESAQQNPDIFYVGFEREETCVARAIRKAQERDLHNLCIIMDDAGRIDELFDENSVDLIWLPFSDPWPKKRNHKRRLTYPPFLKKYAYILKDHGRLIMKSDNEAFFDDSLGYFENSDFILERSDRDYFDEKEPLTAYQRRFIAEGKPIFYAQYRIDKV